MPQILSQDRKFGMIPVLLTQFLSNWAPRLEQAVIGNSASLITFALGDDDARKLCLMYAPFTAEQIINLDAHEPLVKISVNGKTSPGVHHADRAHHQVAPPRAPTDSAGERQTQVRETSR